MMAGSRREDKGCRWEQFSGVIINAVGWHVERRSNRQIHSWSDKVTGNEMMGADERALGSREVCDPGEGSHCVCECEIQVRVMWWRSRIVIDDTVGEIQRGSSLSSHTPSFSFPLPSFLRCFHSLTWSCIHVCACSHIVSHKFSLKHPDGYLEAETELCTIQNWIENAF